MITKKNNHGRLKYASACILCTDSPPGMLVFIFCFCMNDYQTVILPRKGVQVYIRKKRVARNYFLFFNCLVYVLSCTVCVGKVYTL